MGGELVSIAVLNINITENLINSLSSDQFIRYCDIQ